MSGCTEFAAKCRRESLHAHTNENILTSRGKGSSEGKKGERIESKEPDLDHGENISGGLPKEVSLRCEG